MIYKIIEYIMSIPKSLYFNLKYLEFKKAVRLPMLVSYKTNLKELKGKIDIPVDSKLGTIKIGFGDVGIFDKAKRRTQLQITGNIIFRGKANIGHGSSLSVSGKLYIGNNFRISAESSIICNNFIEFGDECLISWDCLIMDTDFHKIYDLTDNKFINKDREIKIGNNVWIGCRNLILKGVTIKDNTIVSAQSKVCSKFEEENVIISGNPAKISRKNVYWRV